MEGVATVVQVPHTISFNEAVDTDGAYIIILPRLYCAARQRRDILRRQTFERRRVFRRAHMAPTSDDVGIVRHDCPQLGPILSELNLCPDGRDREADVHPQQYIAQKNPKEYEKHVHHVARPACFVRATLDEHHCAYN